MILSDPLSLPCGRVLPNRVMKAALSEVLGDLGQSPDQRILRLYRRWSEGGFGLLLTGNVMIDRAQLGEPGNIVIDDERDLATLTRWAETAHAGGSPIWMQLCHPGRQANPVVNRQAPVAPSAIAADIPGFRVPTALTERDIHDIIDRFATTARIAEKAGFDGVQIHAAHGYLVSQFLSPLANHRDDDWGGDPARRARFLLEIVRRVRATVGPQFAVSVKLNSADFQRGGFTEDESSDVVARLAIERIDLLEISGGSFESLAMMGRPTDRLGSPQQREAYFLEYAHTVRANAGAIPLAVTGGFRSRAAMVAALETGDCDIIGLGRPVCLLPDAGRALLAGEEQLPSARVSRVRTGPISRSRTVRSLAGAVDLQWHTDQLHRMAAGAEPAPQRSRWRTAYSMVQRNGVDAFRRKRG
ncbi:NADH:flavin oxidoreductase/NADH oxidase family protein [Nocardia sp. NPDC023852]|uniref:NADH:flavin oxidoreductase/NADH oxidase family protein n=1 Tax=Nocardia sp. NPDC023852 TaxID=3154697 RepID=UPI0033D59AF6